MATNPTTPENQNDTGPAAPAPTPAPTPPAGADPVGSEAEAAGAPAPAPEEPKGIFDKVLDFVTGGTTPEEESSLMDVQEKTRMQEQCYLGYHMTELASIHRQTHTPLQATSEDEDENSQIQSDLEQVQDFPHYAYNKTSLLEGRPADIIPKLRMRKDAHHILDATTNQLAHLVPMIKLYKIVNTATTSYEIPFKFYNHTITESDAKKDWADDPTTEFQNGVGGFQGRSAVGIKSFDWQFIAGNFDTVQKDITAKLVLYFQSMDELIRVRQTQVMDTEKDEMITLTYSYLDLVVNPASSNTPTNEADLSRDSAGPGSDSACTSNSNYDSSIYEIKASVGWAQYDSITQELSSNFIESVNQSKTNLFLSLTDHSFEISPDGTFELVITYRSRMEGILESPKSNVLFCDKNIVTESASFKALIGYEERLASLNKEKCADNKKEKEELKKGLKKIQDGLRNETYKNIIMNLMYPERFLGGFQAGDDSEPQRLIYSVLVDPAALLELADTGKISTESLNQIGAGKISTSDMVFEGPPWSELSVASEGDGQIVYDVANPEEKLINFFYLGDLLDMLMITVFDAEKYDTLTENVRTKYSFNRTEVENLKLLLGPIEYRDPIDKKIKNINIADIPISVRSFTDWFHRKVILKRRVIYEFQSFIKDLAKDLYQTALGKECFEDIERHRSSLRTAFISAPLNTGSDANFKDPIHQAAFDQDMTWAMDVNSTARVDMNQITVKNPIFNFDGLTNTFAVDHVHYITMFSQGPGGLRYPGTPGNDLEDGMTPREQDLEKGIHHLFIGRDRGLITNVTFSKTNQPYVRQARLENAGAFNPILQLSDVYEANIEMMGNTMYLPGSRLYLNPFGLAWGENFGMPHNRGTIANIMGLGGYHIVTSVNNYIESGVFKTTMEARFETSGDGCVATNANNDDTEPCPDETS